METKKESFQQNDRHLDPSQQNQKHGFHFFQIFSHHHPSWIRVSLFFLLDLEERFGSIEAQYTSQKKRHPDIFSLKDTWGIKKKIKDRRSTSTRREQIPMMSLRRRITNIVLYGNRMKRKNKNESHSLIRFFIDSSSRERERDESVPNTEIPRAGDPSMLCCPHARETPRLFSTSSSSHTHKRAHTHAHTHKI